MPIINCTECGEEYRRSKNSKATRQWCRVCVLKEMNAKVNKQGPTHHAWKHGRNGWGRYNKDKDGLDFRKQRVIAKERDNYTCQLCKLRVRQKGKLDSHHIIKYEHLRSHALDNLISLCKPCHINYEKIYEATGQSIFLGEFNWPKGEEVPF